MNMILPSIGALILSLLFFSWQKEWIIINLQPAIELKKKITHIEQKECIMHWNNTSLRETKKIIWTDDSSQNLHYLINTWLTYLHEEDLYKQLHVETVMLNKAQNELFISFDRSPFNKQQSIAQKLQFVQNLSKIIKDCSHSTSMRILVHHKPLQDNHLDFSSSWHID